MEGETAMRKLIMVALIGALLGPVAPARADHDSQTRNPPRVRLIHDGEVAQRAFSWSYCWSYSTDDYGVVQCGDGFPEYPDADLIDGSPRVTLRIPYSAEPKRLRIAAYRKIKEKDGWEQTVGEGERLEYSLKPHREKGHIEAWDAVFKLDEADRHYYLDVYTRLQQGDPAYALHVRT